MKKIATGLPVYNAESTIEHAINSLLKQETKTSIYVRDNASTDNTVSSIKGLDSSISVAANSRNEGGARNFCLVSEDAQSEDYFHWAASDDLWEENWTSENLRSLSNSDAKLSFGKVVHINDVGEEITLPSNRFVLAGLKSKSALRRKVYFFMLPEFYGQANPIYGLFELRFLKSLIRDFGFREESYCDYLFMSKVIEISPIEINGSKHYKRISEDSWEKQQKQGYYFKRYSDYPVYLVKLILRSQKRDRKSVV